MSGRKVRRKKRSFRCEAKTYCAQHSGIWRKPLETGIPALQISTKQSVGKAKWLYYLPLEGRPPQPQGTVHVSEWREQGPKLRI